MSVLTEGCGTDALGAALVDAHAQPHWPSFFPPDLLVFAPDRELLGRLRFDASPSEHLELLRQVLHARPDLRSEPVSPLASVGAQDGVLQAVLDEPTSVDVLVERCGQAGLALPAGLQCGCPSASDAPLSPDDEALLLCVLADRLALDSRWAEADAVWDQVLDVYANSPLVHRARYNRLERRSTWVSAPHPALRLAPPRQLLPARVPNPVRRAHWQAQVRTDPRYRLAATGLPVVWVPPGTFTMGGTPALAERELPTRSVTLTHGVWVAAYAVSRRIWARFQPERFTEAQLQGVHGDLPVSGVTWTEAQAFCAFWSSEVGAPARLLTEAEWERAARGGFEGCPYPWGEAPISADRCNATEPFAVPVGCYAPNPYGLFDMVGNGLEWTADLYRDRAYAETPRTLTDPTGPTTPDIRDHYACRGGFFGASFTEHSCRVSFRLGFEDCSLDSASATVGVRIAFDTLPPEALEG